ncbi:membrane dipeptidase [Parapedobacter sp. ISTM3]|uniref:dipeptidase n=1 Tax=Parapedobacter sp. ISTM3 TaxID=2800130 RepID=UPI00190850CC|nr:membrane dipeptidase [Parapedobacter sp. ISTM3]MBK1441853.1 membrane dipeptidase [Parapedobacter sp. ISTM3]
MLIIDAHLDLAMNAMEWNRDLTADIDSIRARESGMQDKPDRGNNVVSLPELRKGRIGLVVATQIARVTENHRILPGWYSPEQAWAQTQGQLAWYRAMIDTGEMQQITDLTTLERHIALWEDEGVANDTKPVGFMLSLEGADSLIDLSYLERAYAYGLRAIGPAHYGPGRYAPGTGMEGPLTPLGVELLKEMDHLHMVLDITHLTDAGFWQAMAIYKGPVWASHHNCRALVNHQRQLDDDQLDALIERGAIIGSALDAWMLAPNWTRGKSTPSLCGVNLDRLADHIDHICQLAGNSNHAAIGSDLDGMFGSEQCPYDLSTIADLRKLEGILEKRGYTASDRTNIFHGNWLRFIRRAWKNN